MKPDPYVAPSGREVSSDPAAASQGDLIPLAVFRNWWRMLVYSATAGPGLQFPEAPALGWQPLAKTGL